MALRNLGNSTSGLARRISNMLDFFVKTIKSPFFPADLKPAMLPVVQAFMIQAVKVSKQDYLTGPRPEKLGVITGTLRRSIRQETKVSGHTIQGTIGTNTSYGAKHELGLGVPKRPFLRPPLENNIELLQKALITEAQKRWSADKGV